jgi:hypothetical protein
MSINYEKGEIPKTYKCAICEATNVKLWRLYMSYDSTLRCARCAAMKTGTDISTINEDGIRISSIGLECTDQIGSYIPAVPSKNGYWGYSSVPQEAITWWKRLKTLSNT